MTMSIYNIKKSLITLGLAFVSILFHETYAQIKPVYNVLLVVVDDMNDWIGPFGVYEGIKTPNIDKLAQKGVVFKRAYCAAPACNPSRTSLLTGIRPSTSGVYHNNQPWRPVLPDAVTLPQYFKANGYEVKGAGKIFHLPFNDSASWPVYFDVPNSPKPPEAPVNGFSNFDWSPVDVKDEDMGDYEVVSQGINYFRQKRDKPFFLAIGLTRPHLPWYVPQKYYDQYPLSSIKLPEIIANDLADVPAAGVKIANPKGDHKFITENNQWEKAIQGYLASITFADAQLGRLLDALEKSDYADNTIIVFLSDHGWHLGEKEHWRKFALWEEASRVPLIVYAPGISKENSVSGRTVNLLDIYPTLVELCSLPVKKELEGNNIVPLLKNPSAPWEFPSITTHGFENHAVRSEKWRYIRYRDGSEELYDHDNDPNEFKNLANDKKYAAEKLRLKKSLPLINTMYDAAVKKANNN